MSDKHRFTDSLTSVDHELKSEVQGYEAQAERSLLADRAKDEEATVKWMDEKRADFDAGGAMKEKHETKEKLEGLAAMAKEIYPQFQAAVPDVSQETVHIKTGRKAVGRLCKSISTAGIPPPPGAKPPTAAEGAPKGKRKRTNSAAAEGASKPKQAKGPEGKPKRNSSADSAGSA